MVGGDSGELHGVAGVRIVGHPNRILPRGARGRGGVRRGARSAGARVLTGEREAAPGRGGAVGGGFGEGEIEGGGGFGIGGDSRDRARSGTGSLVGEGSCDVSEFEP